MTTPENDAEGSELADWLELQALASATPVPFDSLNAGSEAQEEEEPEEIDGEDLVKEERVQKCAAIISRRRNALGASYPFQVVDSGTSLVAVERSRGAQTYVFCLLASNLVPGGFVSIEGQEERVQEARELMQVCSTIAVAGHQAGPSYSLGWPRSDFSGFLEKLREIYRAYGDGEIVDAVPRGAPASVKDDGVDVVGWKKLDGDLPSQSYILFQAAAGKHWDVKSTMQLPGLFHGTWFAKAPASGHHARVGIAIPFALFEDVDREEAHGAFRRKQLTFGEVLTRLQLPGMMAAGFSVATTQHVDDVNRFDEVLVFNESVISALA